MGLKGFVVAHQGCLLRLPQRWPRIVPVPHMGLGSYFGENSRTRDSFGPLLQRARVCQHEERTQYQIKLTSRNLNTEGVIPMLSFTFEGGRSISGGG